jgi:hypothetical protein
LNAQISLRIAQSCKYLSHRIPGGSVDLPATGQVMQASTEAPYPCLQVSINLREISDLVSRFDKPLKSDTSSRRGLFIGKADEALVDAIVRLTKFLISFPQASDRNEPTAISKVSPITEGAMHYANGSGGCFTCSLSCRL